MSLKLLKLLDYHLVHTLRLKYIKSFGGLFKHDLKQGEYIAFVEYTAFVD